MLATVPMQRHAGAASDMAFRGAPLVAPSTSATYPAGAAEVWDVRWRAGGSSGSRRSPDHLLTPESVPSHASVLRALGSSALLLALAGRRRSVAERGARTRCRAGGLTSDVVEKASTFRDSSRAKAWSVKTKKKDNKFLDNLARTNHGEDLVTSDVFDFRRVSPFARSKRTRCVGTVKSCTPVENKGTISWNENVRGTTWGVEIPFVLSAVPEEILEQSNGIVPPGTPVEFEIFELDDGSRLADNFTFPQHKTFEMLGLSRELVEGAAAALGSDPRDNPDAPDLITPAPVQAAAIPRLLAGDQVCVASETGSGKTLAYMLPLVDHVLEVAQGRGMDYGVDSQSTASAPIGLIICPTRELVVQAFRSLKLISFFTKLNVRLVHGGSLTWKWQKDGLMSQIDVLVATPDRLLKFWKNDLVSFKAVRYIALDEADFLLTQGFDDLEEVLTGVERECMCRSHRLHWSLATASITKPLRVIFRDDPRWSKLQVLESKSLHRPQANCSHSFLMTRGRDKLEMLISLLRPEVTGAVASKQTIVFCNGISSCKSIAYQLKLAFERDRAYQHIGVLHKELQWQERDEVIRSFARGELRVIIASDIAQRGLDLPRCGHVINFDFPMNSIDYLHRAGRTARYGEVGKVSSLVLKRERVLAKAVEKAVELGRPIDDLSSDRRDYLRGGNLSELMKTHHNASRADRGLPAPRAYGGSLR